ncbi:MAG: hypothetical protein F2545_01250 [Actinobacteria bacterium]|uniref:Unannotated protein n=1 Tax=freshwater metagenome TaxID=449393 RepID=A0A6J6CQB0_9ZZZZ|nr:hypothetical protein [Actinomycetota bacterium]
MFNRSIDFLKRKWRETLLVVVLVSQGLLGVILGIQLFYRAGVYFLDAGYYIYTLASENFGQQPPAIGDAWGSTLYATHMLITPLIITQVLRIFVDEPLNFIAFLGIQNFILSVAGAMLMMVSFWLNGVKRNKLILPGIMGALLLPFTNVGLGSLLYPHVELIGTSLAAIAVLLFALRWSAVGDRRIFVVAIVLLVLGLLAREDIGVHLAVTVSSAVVCSQWRNLGKQGLIRASWLLGAGVAAVAVLMGYQRFFADSKGVFALTYSGTPAYAHITSVWYLLDRVMHMLSSRLDLLVGLAAFVMAFFVLRKREYLAFPLAMLPWLLLNLTAIDPAKNAMGIYHLFPVVLYATAPVLALTLSGRREEDETTSPSRGSVPMYATYGVAVLSLFLGGVSAAPTGGGSILTSLLRLPPISPAGITATHTAIEDFAEIGIGITVDDAVMAIRPVELRDTPLIPVISDSGDYNSALFFPRYYLGHKGVRQLLKGWSDANRSITVTCLPGGLVRLDAAEPALLPIKPIPERKFDRALRCHPFPKD